ncbi:MAG: family 78 glycoside hydrolase catalytic domain [Cyclobacteriaceae bacterium]|nr:family 78 glycoside hydrolase catalytic domain [Cyclobacteriaceae bacterium]
MNNATFYPYAMRNVLLLLLSVSFFINACTGTYQPVELTCEYLQNPLGIDVLQPRLSWKIQETQEGYMQSAYQIIAAFSEEMLDEQNPKAWNSGKINTSQSVHVLFQGPAGQTGDRVYWKVRTWDQAGKASQWSQTSWWEYGLLHKDTQNISWIGKSYPSLLPEVVGIVPCFRKEFQVDKSVRKARAYISGLGYHELSINGRKVSDDLLSPNQTNYDRRHVESWDEARIGNMQTTVLYQTYDVIDFLQTGSNALGIMLGNGWYIQTDRVQDSSLWYDTPRLMFQLHIEYTTGETEIIHSDTTWKYGDGPIRYNGLHSGEVYDARLENENWDLPGFNDKHWQNAINQRPPAGKLKAQMSAPDRVIKTLQPKSNEKLSDRTHRYDFGQMFSGWVKLKVKAAPGTEITLRFFEDGGASYGQKDVYIAKGSDEFEIWEPRFTWHAFRFVEVNGPAEAIDLEGRVVNTDVKLNGTFESSNALFNKILENFEWTQPGNMHGGIPSDCPHRERRGYTGDGQVAAKAAIYHFDMASFYTKWLRDMQDAQNAQTGYVPNTVPYQDGGGGTAWGSAYVIIPWYMYLYYGDTAVLHEHYDGMKKWLQYLENEKNEEGLLENQGLGEWVPPDFVQLPTAFVNTSYFYLCASLMADISAIAGTDQEVAFYRAMTASLASDINRKFFDSEAMAYSINRQGANTFPLAFGIADRNHTDQIIKSTVHQLETETDFHFDTGILATPLLLEALSTLGYTDIAYALMNQRDFPGFGHMIENGATSIWETWLGEQSRSHPMFGSVCGWFYEYLGGIRPDPEQPGFKNVIVQPHPVKALDFVNTSYTSPYGKIHSSWRWDNEDLIMEVQIPPNSTASIYVPAESPQNIQTKSKTSLEKVDARYAMIEAGPGKHQFRSRKLKGSLADCILATPLIDPVDSVFEKGNKVQIRLNHDHKEAELFYTLDGSKPDRSSQRYSGPFDIEQDLVCKAIAFHPDFKPSFVKRASFSFIDAERNGLNYRYYSGVWEKLPDYEKLQPVKSGATYRFSLDEIPSKEDAFGLVYEGWIEIPERDEYTFYLTSNDGAILYINDKMLIDYDGLHGADEERSNTLSLDKGFHPIRLHYFQAGGGLYLKVSYASPGIGKTEIPAGVLYRKLP